MNDLITSVGLPQRIEKIKLSDILKIMKHDKKFISGKNRFVLARGLGKVKVVEGISLDVIQKAIKNYMV